jgi:hypothetical protein
MCGGTGKLRRQNADVHFLGRRRRNHPWSPSAMASGLTTIPICRSAIRDGPSFCSISKNSLRPAPDLVRTSRWARSPEIVCKAGTAPSPCPASELPATPCPVECWTPADCRRPHVVAQKIIEHRCFRYLLARCPIARPGEPNPLRRGGWLLKVVTDSIRTLRGAICPHELRASVTFVSVESLRGRRRCESSPHRWRRPRGRDRR